jgi:hypothetical protein
MKQLVDGLHENGQHWIAITDAGVAADEGYAAYEDGEKESVFIKAATGDSYLGQVRGWVWLVCMDNSRDVIIDGVFVGCSSRCRHPCAYILGQRSCKVHPAAAAQQFASLRPSNSTAALQMQLTKARTQHLHKRSCSVALPSFLAHLSVPDRCGLERLSTLTTWVTRPLLHG